MKKGNEIRKFFEWSKWTWQSPPPSNNQYRFNRFDYNFHIYRLMLLSLLLLLTNIYALDCISFPIIIAINVIRQISVVFLSILFGSAALFLAIYLFSFQLDFVLFINFIS